MSLKHFSKIKKTTNISTCLNFVIIPLTYSYQTQKYLAIKVTSAAKFFEMLRNNLMPCVQWFSIEVNRAHSYEDSFSSANYRPVYVLSVIVLLVVNTLAIFMAIAWSRHRSDALVIHSFRFIFQLHQILFIELGSRTWGSLVFCWRL